LDEDFYKEFLQGYPGVQSIRGNTYGLLLQSEAALVTSGTATLETALFGVPEAVCYKGDPISYQIARRLIKVKYISLVNLIMDKPVVRELIQDDMNPTTVGDELERLLNNEAYRARIKEDYASLKTLLQQDGDASAQAARQIVAFSGKNA